MFSWISANIGTILITVLILALVILIIIKLKKDKKQGKTSCGANCAGCAMRGSCHKT